MLFNSTGLDFVSFWCIPTYNNQKHPKKKKGSQYGLPIPTYHHSLIRFFSMTYNYAKHPQLCTPDLVRPKQSFDFAYNTKYKIFLNQLLFKIGHMLWEKQTPQILRKAEITLQEVALMVNFSQCQKIATLICLVFMSEYWLLLHFFSFN